MKNCFTGAEVLLPENQVDKRKWAVVACDQYTSQVSYWQDVEAEVSDAPSTLRITFPEVYLGEDNRPRIAAINETMNRYLHDGILVPAVENGYVLVVRDTPAGRRLGLIGKIDLEDYDYRPGTTPLIRATEQTVVSRIPPRVKIRENAVLEAPHIMLLVDDPAGKLVEGVYEKYETLRCLYDTELMKNGGRLAGYAVEGADAKALDQVITEMQAASNGFFFAVGDGNHSLATAKACWDAVKPGLTPEEQKVHPSRFALVEIVNLHSPALVFEPIHRLVENVDPENLLDGFRAYLKGLGMSLGEGDDLVFVSQLGTKGYGLENAGGRLSVEVLQKYLDGYLQEHKDASIDYIHGQQALLDLCQEKPGRVGIFLKSIDKHSLFPAIAAGGVLPRKTFSMGEADEKRFYMECRKIR